MWLLHLLCHNDLGGFGRDGLGHLDGFDGGDLSVRRVYSHAIKTRLERRGGRKGDKRVGG